MAKERVGSRNADSKEKRKDNAWPGWLFKSV